MEHLISIVVPVYGVEQYLSKCIESILKQTYSNLEIILVDDGSPDNCGEICDSYAEKDKRIRVIHKQNGGLSDARNAGLKVAKGDYIGFVDSDDWIDPDMFEYLIEGIKSNQAEIGICNVYDVYKYRIEVKSIEEDIVYSSSEALKELFSDNLENYAWNKLYKASLWDGVEFPVGKNFEDIQTIYKTFEKANRIVILQEPKYYYLHRASSISGTIDFSNRRHVYSAFIDRYEEVAPRLPQYREELFSRFRKWYIHELSWAVVHRPELRGANLYLLGLMSPFVGRHLDELADLLDISNVERKKWSYFAEGDISGCKKSLKYHKRLKRRNQRQKKT